MATTARVASIIAVGSVVAAGIATALSVHSKSPPSASAMMRSALEMLDSTAFVARSSSESVDREVAVSLGYVERLRLGMGSPFRLVEQALRDQRMDPPTREALAWGLVGRLLRGDFNVVDPVVFADAAPGLRQARSASGAPPAAGDPYLELVERAVHSHENPRVGESVVRMAFALAAAEGVVSQRAARTAGDAAALLRDRVLASHDVRDLLARARGERTDLFAEIQRARASRTLRVEAPLLAGLPAEHEMRAIERTGKLLADLRILAQVAHEQGTTVHSLVGPAVAEPLSSAGRSLPPQSATVIAVASERHALRVAASENPFDTTAFFAATNEETLAGAYAGLVRQGSVPPAVSRSMLAVSVALRSYAQEKVWFPGEPGSRLSEVLTEFGLADVTFAPEVPKAWRPFYLGVISSAFRDMRRVFPAYSTAGLSISIVAGPLPDGALALHDPRTRTLRLTVTTPAGALAHELAHDMDWAAARRLFGSAGGYSTDRAVQAQTGKLATSMRGLTAAHPIGAGASTGSAGRPTEVFARSVEWLVATELAAAGRSNGYLFGVQQAVVPGPTAGTPTAIGPMGTSALVAAVSQMTYLPDSVSARFSDTWGDTRALDLQFVLARLLAVPVRSEQLTSDEGSAIGVELEALGKGPFACSSVRGSDDRRLTARSALLELAVESRARGLAMRAASAFPVESRPAWARALLGQVPWTADAGGIVLTRSRAAVRDAIHSSGISSLGFVPTVPEPFRTVGC